MVLRVSNAIGEEIVRKDGQSSHFLVCQGSKTMQADRVTGMMIDEQFFPLIAPSSPIQFDAEPTIDQNGEILAKNLEGLWCVKSFSASNYSHRPDH